MASRAELSAVLEVQRDAFSRVAREFGIPEDVLPPLRETISDLEALHERGTRFFSAVDQRGVVVGAVRASEVDGAVEIGRLAVADGWQGRGVATALMDALEASYPAPVRFTLFTGVEAAAPLALYRGRGYQETRVEDVGHVKIVWLEKRL